MHQIRNGASERDSWEYFSLICLSVANCFSSYFQICFTLSHLSHLGYPGPSTCNPFFNHPPCLRGLLPSPTGMTIFPTIVYDSFSNFLCFLYIFGRFSSALANLTASQSLGKYWILVARTGDEAPVFLSDNSLEKSLMLGKIEGRRRRRHQRMRWLDGITNSTHVWMNSGSWWWTGRPGVLRFMG